LSGDEHRNRGDAVEEGGNEDRGRMCRCADWANEAASGANAQM